MRSIATMMPLSLALAASALAGAVEPPLPAAPGRGFFMRPAIQGDRLVFVSEGDLWSARLPADLSGPIEAGRLTSGTGTESAPVLSPDGSMVAFEADYDGTPEVYVMPVTGGSPRRLTFHPSMERPLAFTPDGQRVLYRSNRANPLGRNELWTVPVTGGPSEPVGIGEGSLASIDPVSGRMAFNPWSNETASWKRYRGGTAPDVWIASADRTSFTRLTRTPENELFPMWVQGRVWFLSDPDGVMNLWSDRPEGGDRKRHTDFGGGQLDAAWASADPARDGTRIVFTRGADVCLFDAKDGSLRTLDLRLVGDRFADRLRSRAPMDDATSFSLGPDAALLAIESRGEFMVVPLVKGGGEHPSPAMQVPGSGATRERGAAWVEDGLACVAEDEDGQRLVVLDLENPASSPRELLRSDVWLLDPVGSPGGDWIAVGDKTGLLRAIRVADRKVIEVARSSDGEIRDFRFSPDGRWIAWTHPLPSGMGQVRLRNLETGETASVGEGMTNDHDPRWDPAGAYLYFLSARHIDPVVDELDLDFANIGVTVPCVLPLLASTPPPSVMEAEEAGMDLASWALGGALHGATDDEDHGEAGPEADEPEVTIDTRDMAQRVIDLPVKPGQFDGFEAIRGGVILGRREPEGVSEVPWPTPPLGVPHTTLERFEAMSGQAEPLLGQTQVSAWTIDPSSTQVAAWDGLRMRLVPVDADAVAAEPSPPGSEGPGRSIDLSGLAVRVDPRSEWRQIFDEAWRLQKDFFWRSDMGGVDWLAVRQRYRPLVERVGTREELNELLGWMGSELGNSHVYIQGGETFRQPEPVSVGVLGADLERRDGAWVIARVLPDRRAEGGPESPLAAPFRGVKPGTVIRSVNGRPVRGDGDPGEALVGCGGRPVVLEVADDAKGTNARFIRCTLPEDESKLRYLDWVETNRRTVSERSGGRLGYMHLPDMDTDGITAFMRGFYPQVDREGWVVDARNNGGGYVSPVIAERLARRPWSYTVPREGRVTTNPQAAPRGPIAVLIDQDAGSDGDIFPETMRTIGAGTLIGTRTWGGVVGIDMSKDFTDGGMASQPGYGHWTPSRGYAIENEGVKPDIEVEITPADRQAGRDPQLERAVDFVKGKLPATRFTPPRPETQPSTSPPPKPGT
jgi:tricorn protease